MWGRCVVTEWVRRFILDDLATVARGDVDAAPVAENSVVDELDALDIATREFGRRLDDVSTDQLVLPTPCDEWDVRYLIAHVVGGNRFATLVLDGMPSSEAIHRIMSTAQLGDRPKDDFSSTSAEQRRKFRSPGALDRSIDHPIGVISTRRFLRFRVFDCTLHAWDLAVAIGADATLDPDLVDAVLHIVRSEPTGMGFGIEPATAIDRNPQQELLALSGRADGHSRPVSTQRRCGSPTSGERVVVGLVGVRRRMAFWSGLVEVATGCRAKLSGGTR